MEQGWTVVAPKRRRPKKQEGKEERGDDSPGETRKESAGGSREENWRESRGDGRGESKSKAKGKQTPGTEAELVALIRKIVDNTPKGKIQLSLLGDRVQEAVGKPWNKKYRTSFGPILSFVQKHNEAFVVKDRVVSLRSGDSPLAARKRVSKGTAQPKPTKAEALPLSPKPRKVTAQSITKRESSSGSCGLLLFFTLLIAAVAFTVSLRLDKLEHKDLGAMVSALLGRLLRQ